MGKADSWYHNWVRGRSNQSWEEFEADLCRRFGEKGLEDVVEEFMKMRQEGFIGDYQDKFEDIRVRMERFAPALEENYFLSGFIGGLRDEIRPMVRMLRPTNLAHAFEIARLQEQLLHNNGKPALASKPTFTFYKNTSNSNTINPQSLTYITAQLHHNFPYTTKPPNESTISKSASNVPTKPYSMTSTNSVNQTSTKPSNTNLVNTTKPSRPCYRCGDKFFPGHQCKPKAVMALQIEEQGKESGDEYLEEGVIEEALEMGQTEAEMTLSVHAIEGSQGEDTIKVLGRYKDRQLVILVDSGSTNTFLDKRVAQELKIPLVQIPPTVVRVADGRQIMSSTMCSEFQWQT